MIKMQHEKHRLCSVISSKSLNLVYSPLGNSLCLCFDCRVKVSGSHHLPKGTALLKCLA